jgi:hypothetical protein
MFRKTLIAAVAGVAATLTLAVTIDMPAKAAQPTAKTAGFAKELTIAPSYSNQNRLSVNSFAYRDALPEYGFAISEAATGRSIPTGYGYASGLGDSDFESDYSIQTNEPLVVGTVYEAYFHMSTVRFWHCSIYDPDGCSYEAAEQVTSRWRFTYTGASPSQTVEAYTPTSKIDLGRKTKMGAHGWRITQQLTSEGAPIPRAFIEGQYRLGSGGWRHDSTFRTDTQGRLKITFRGEDRPTSYRFRYDGVLDDISGSVSRPLSIKKR